MPDSEPDKTPPPDVGEDGLPLGASHHRLRSGALIGIFVLLILYTAYFAKPILIPMALAFLLSLILAPAVGWLARLYIPRPLGAALVLAILLTGFGAGIYGLAGPALHWIKEAPHAVEKLERTVHSVSGPMEAIHKTEKKMKHITDGNSSSASEPRRVRIVGEQNILHRVIPITPEVLSGFGIAIVLLYFLLAASDSFLRSLTHVIPRWGDKKRTVEVARNIQYHISRYLATITLINIGVGLVDGIALWAIGMPNPILWGAMIALFNYVPYIGSTAAIVILTLIALITFSHIGAILLVPAVILAVAILEGQFVTPHVVGRRLALSPVAIFIMLVVCGFIWGIVGIIIAVPLLACFKLVCEEIEALNPIAEFLTVYYVARPRH